MKEPIFILSLNLKLGWGFILDQIPKSLIYLKNPKKIREKIKNLIKLLEKYNILATWGGGWVFIF